MSDILILMEKANCKHEQLLALLNTIGDCIENSGQYPLQRRQQIQFVTLSALATDLADEIGEILSNAIMELMKDRNQSTSPLSQMGTMHLY